MGVIDGRSGLTPRVALALVRQLPIESRTTARLRGGAEFVGWGPDRYLLARLIDAVEGHWWTFVAANSKRKPKQPDPVERPDARARKKKQNGFMAAASRVVMATRNKRKKATTDGEESGR